jgi:hypothetical protein
MGILSQSEFARKSTISNHLVVREKPKDTKKKGKRFFAGNKIFKVSNAEHLQHYSSSALPWAAACRTSSAWISGLMSSVMVISHTLPTQLFLTVSSLTLQVENHCSLWWFHSIIGQSLIMLSSLL